MINDGLITAEDDEENASSSPAVKSAGSTSNPLILSLSLRPAPLEVPDVLSSYYLSRDVLDYGEMTALGFDSLVRDVMGVEGGRLSIYNELDITPPQNPKNRKEGIAKKLELREEGWSGYSGLKLGEALESDLIKASEPVDEVELPVNPGVLPVTKNPEAPQTAVWTASKLDQQGKVTGRAVSWAREMREERILSEKGKGDGTFELLGVKVRAANQLWVSAWILWFALFVGQGEESWSEYTGASLGPLIALGLKGFGVVGAVGWIGIGGKLLLDGKGVGRALVGPDFEEKG